MFSILKDILKQETGADVDPHLPFTVLFMSATKDIAA